MSNELITLTISLTRDEWGELLEALYSKANLIRNGDYGEEDMLGFKPEDWAKELGRIEAEITAIANKNGLIF